MTVIAGVDLVWAKLIQGFQAVAAFYILQLFLLFDLKCSHLESAGSLHVLLFKMMTDSSDCQMSPTKEKSFIS